MEEQSQSVILTQELKAPREELALKCWRHKDVKNSHKTQILSQTSISRTLSTSPLVHDMCSRVLG